MKIKSPLSSRDEVEPLVDSGADEFFCGIIPPQWRKKSRNIPLNKRSLEANFTSFEDLHEAIDTAHRLGAQVHITVNAFFYREEQYLRALELIEDVMALDADGVILSDLGMIALSSKMLEKHGVDLVIGTNAVIFNHLASDFYKRLGAKRVVLDRSLTVREIRDIVMADRSMEYEVFIMNNLCYFIDGFCSFCKEMSWAKKWRRPIGESTLIQSQYRVPRATVGCKTDYLSKKISLSDGRLSDSSNRFTFWSGNPSRGCGACALFDFHAMGVQSVKVLDRGLPTKEKVRSTRFVRESLDILENEDVSREEFVKLAKDGFIRTFGTQCTAYDCHYPRPPCGKGSAQRHRLRWTKR
jgi:U32 family peptidase